MINSLQKEQQNKSSSEDNQDNPSDLKVENVLSEYNMFSFNEDYKQNQHSPGLLYE